ncbi:MAG: hypothetical protein AAFP19_00875 [Bacteroidota bacterium]
MIALAFSNLVFLAYTIYLILERRESFYKYWKFWWVFIALLISLYITYLYVPLDLATSP